MFIPMSSLRPLSELSIALESVFIGCKAVVHGPDGLSFSTQAMRLLMFCVRYLDLYWIQSDPIIRLSMRLFLLLSTLTVVMLLGYKKFSQSAHRNVSRGTIGEVTVILLFSAALGAAFMSIPTVPEFLWTFSRFIDVVVEVPQLKMVYVSKRLDRWIITYYCCIASHVLLYTLRLVYSNQPQDIYEIISPWTTISKGVVIAIFFAARFFNQRKEQPASGPEKSLLGSDAPVHQQVDQKSPTNAVAVAV